MNAVPVSGSVMRAAGPISPCCKRHFDGADKSSAGYAGRLSLRLAAMVISSIARSPAAIGFVGDSLAQPWIGDVIHCDDGHAMPVARGRADVVQCGVVGCAAQVCHRVLCEHRHTVQ